MVEKVDGGQKLSWGAEADFESGLQQFIILRDGKEIGRVPEKLNRRFGSFWFQGLSYHDTPEQPLPKMTFLDKQPTPGNYTIVAVNGAGLRSDGK